MTLEAALIPQELFAHTHRELCTIAEQIWGVCDLGLNENKEDQKRMMTSEDWHPNSTASPEDLIGGLKKAAGFCSRRKRRESRKCMRNKEEVESQRITHIAMERNRRKQMNEYLSVLRSLMPPSYVHRGDQASIVGGAINFVKELEQLVQSLEVNKRLKQQADAASMASLFADFFASPQYTTCSSVDAAAAASCSNGICRVDNKVEENRPSIAADVEVNLVERHANVKVLSRLRPMQLADLIMGIQGLGLMPQYLNVTTLDQMALYSFSLKVEEDCLSSPAEEIAADVYQILGRIQEAANF